MRGSAIAVFCLLIGATAWFYQIYMGLGVAGYRPPVMWGVYIITFVFWVGIGHAGTLISAILYLFRAGFRTTIYRCAEAMTVFAVMTAGLFPILHLGRPWKFFWLIPYPNWRLIWPQFKSPLVWDVFAILTYLTVSATFLFIGLIPDLAVLRDRETNPIRKQIFGVLSFGWRNSDREWRHFARAYLFLAAFSTPLVLSVHSVVSFDFAMANVPGWHTTIFPPYFVAGAIFSGIGMVFTIIIPMRRWFNLKHYVTINDPRRGGEALSLHVAGRRVRVSDRVLHRVVQRQRDRAVVLLEPRLRAVVVGRVDHADLQHGPPAAALLAASCAATRPGCSCSRSSSISACGSSGS